VNPDLCIRQYHILYQGVKDWGEGFCRPRFLPQPEALLNRFYSKRLRSASEQMGGRRSELLFLGYARKTQRVLLTPLHPLEICGRLCPRQIPPQNHAFFGASRIQKTTTQLLLWVLENEKNVRDALSIKAVPRLKRVFLRGLRHF